MSWMCFDSVFHELLMNEYMFRLDIGLLLPLLKVICRDSVLNQVSRLLPTTMNDIDK